MNQVVQVILANGQVVTTTLAAIQQQQQQQQQLLAQPAVPAAAQLVYNPVTGQTQVLQFAAIPDQSQSQQLVTVNGHQFIAPIMMQPQQQQEQQQQILSQVQQHQQQLPAAQIVQLVNQMPAPATQVLINPATGQIVGQLAPQSFNLGTMQMIPTLNGQQQLVSQCLPVPQQAAPVQQQHQSSPQSVVSNQLVHVSDSDATRLHVQRVIQQQQQQILQQQQQQQRNNNHRQTHVNVLIEQRNRQEQRTTKSVKVLSPLGRVSSTTVNSAVAATAAAAAVPVVVSKSKHHPALILPAAKTATSIIPSQTQATGAGSGTTFHIVTNPVVEGCVRETMLPDAGVHDDDHGQDEDEESCQTSLSSTPSSCSRMEPESTTHSDSSSQATIAHTINTSTARIVDGVNLQDVQEFARSFKMHRLRLGMTQIQVGNALAASQGPTYSQSAICRFEKLEISPKSALKIMPVLKEWMAEAEKLHQSGQLMMTDIVGPDSNKKRKRRTTFSPEATDHLNQFFTEVTQHPDSIQMTELADKLNYDREVIRVWFCNRRQALKKVISKSSNISISIGNNGNKKVCGEYDRDNSATTNSVIPVS